MAKTLVFIPTYNEAENIGNIYQQILDLGLGNDFLFLDDNSPDGTGKIIDELCKQNKQVFAIHRTGKLGIGSAHQEGIAFAYQNGYEVLISMDCDFTHSPSYIIDFIKASSQASIVVGSRYMQKGSLEEWNLFRKSLTNIGHILTKNVLGLKYDATGAFRLYKLKDIPHGIFKLVESPSYSFFFESLFVLDYNKISIVEIPIHLPARTYGTSKMELKDAIKSLKNLVSMLNKKWFNKKSIVYYSK